MTLDFTKMHGAGNDFILIDCRRSELTDIPVLARRLCHRRFGVGADQMLLLHDSSSADFRMAIFNSDGSEVEMCGNGIRCFAKYIWDRGLSSADVLAVETAAGIISPRKAGDKVTVDMGQPVLEARRIPVDLDGRVTDYPLTVRDREFRITCVSMGNPHAVIFVDDVDGFDVGLYGPLIENHALFPNRTNVEFVQKVSTERLKMRVWERGAGETMACGTGACATAVASVIKGVTGRKVLVSLPGGELMIEWSDDDRVYLTGPAVEVFEGRIDLEGLA
jgi:diaminopimelate epimerase